VTRVATGLLLAGLTLLIIKRLPSEVVWIATVVVALLALDELRRIFARLGHGPWVEIAYLGTPALVGSFLLGSDAVAPMASAIIVAALMRALVPTQDPATGIDRALGTITATLWVGIAFGHIAALFPPGASEAARQRGEDLTILLLGVVYIGDTCALYGGKAFGRRKLAPGISPNKTVEGAVCGLLGGLGWALVAHVWFFRRLPLEHALLLGTVLGLVGIAGDLVESLIKRAATVKDSGNLLPGHGGILDRVDSLLLAAPVLYWYARLVLGPP
jgi:phosphatidate cytidylyltransferase